MEARIHLEEPGPPYCAGCHQAVPDKRHVDFGASTDGPMMPALKGTVGVVGHSIDEIVICEVCITEAAKLLGLGNAEDLLAKLETANRTIDAMHDQLGAQRSSVTSALDTLKREVDGGTPPPVVVNSNLPIAPIPVKPKRRARAAR